MAMSSGVLCGVCFIAVIYSVLVLQHQCTSLPAAAPRAKDHGGVPDNNITESFECDLCQLVVYTIQDLAKSNKSFSEIYPEAVKICVSLLEGAGLNGEYMCPGIINAYGVPILVVATDIVLDPATVCEDLNFCSPDGSTKPGTTINIFSLLRALPDLLRDMVLKYSDRAGLCKQSTPTFHPHSKLESSYVGNRTFDPHVQSSNSTSNGARTGTKKPRLPESGNVVFLQLGDIHLDVHYTEGSPTDCCLYFCCRPWYNGTGSAGHYGDYSCDLPKVTLDLLVDTILSLDPAPHFIVYTGDNPPHDIWNETQESQWKSNELVVDYLAQKFPHITIYPAMGNHESWPASEYTGQFKDYQVLTSNLSVAWKKWVELPPEAEATIARGGYYSIQVMEGLRIISFNSNYGYLFNFYAFLNYENEHYHEQWEWLDKELSKASTNSEQVLIIGHIPPGDEDNWGEYGRLYLNITKKYKGIIVGHLYGHTHLDHFQLIQDALGVYGVVMVSPSVTTFGHINPSFRVFTMDAASMQLSGYTQYHLNLTKANELYAKGNEAMVKFEVSYSTEKEYNLDDLSPASWSQLAKNFETDSELLSTFYFNRHGRSYAKERECDASCRTELLCEVNNIISADAITCKAK